MFKKNIYFFAIVFLIGCSSNKSAIKYNGIYQSSKIDNNYYYYLRFYKNNTVIEVSSSGKPKHLKKWFKKEKEGVSIGIYYYENDSLFFKAKSSSGTINYKGIVKKGKLFLKHQSKINGNKSLHTYSFKKVKF